MGNGCDCSHCPGCGDVAEEPKKKAGDAATEPEEAEIPEEVDVDLDDDFDEEDEEAE